MQLDEHESREDKQEQRDEGCQGRDHLVTRANARTWDAQRTITGAVAASTQNVCSPTLRTELCGLLSSPRLPRGAPYTPPTGRGWTGAAGSREDGGLSKETYRACSCLVAGLATCVFVLAIGAAAAQAVTPGWECVPTTAGQAVVSGGTGGAPSCGAGTTAVLAPTFVSSGMGGKPTVQFSALNVQIVNGTTPAARLGFLGRIRAGVREARCLRGAGPPCPAVAAGLSTSRLSASFQPSFALRSHSWDERR